jgi:pyruvate dehydrogenase E1 component alpha subunit
VDGNDMPLVLQAMEYAVETARRNIPNLVWAKTHRWAGHYIGDDQSYEDAGETARFRETDDPLKRFEELLLREGVLTAESIRRIGAETDLRMEKAWEANMEADYPGRDLVLDKSKVYAMPWEGNEV